MQKTISLDSTILNSIQKCPRFYQYSHQKFLQPPEKGEALERGDLLHKIFEIVYGLEANCARPDSELWTSLAEIGIKPAQDMQRDEILNIALNEAPNFFAGKMSLEPQEVEETVYQAREYFKFYEHDSWETLAVEEVGSRLLHEDEELKIIYNAKIDRIARRGELVMPWDHKSSKRRTDPSSLSNQFMGYAWILNSSHILVNKVGFQKTLKPSERFQREILTFDAARLEEWRLNTVWWVRLLAHFIDEGQFPMNLTSCDKYNGCIYKGLCESSPEGREWKETRDFEVGKAWDVASILEAGANK
jgi:hypothetical protein